VSGNPVQSGSVRDHPDIVWICFVHQSLIASFVQNADMDVVYRSFATPQSGTASLWFYDNATDTSRKAIARIDATAWDGSAAWRAMGVDTGTSATKYVYRSGTASTATAVSRIPGWHQLTWDYSSGTDVKMSIDGTLVNTSTGVTGFSTIAIGDWWKDAISGEVYWSDMTAGSTALGFDRLGEWTALGAPRRSHITGRPG
jgi:hypothetical protein